MSRLDLIGISGVICSGKDTVAAIINDITDQRYTVKRFAGKLKVFTSMLTGIPVENLDDQSVKNSTLGPEWSNMTVREVLQRLGTDAVRDNLHKDAWVNALFSDHNSRCRWIIPDTRFPNEFAAIRNRGGIIVRVERHTEKRDLHPSETSLDGFDFDYTIQNNKGITELTDKVTVMLQYFEQELKGVII